MEFNATVVIIIAVFALMIGAVVCLWWRNWGSTRHTIEDNRNVKRKRTESRRFETAESKKRFEKKAHSVKHDTHQLTEKSAIALTPVKFGVINNNLFAAQRRPGQ